MDSSASVASFWMSTRRFAALDPFEDTLKKRTAEAVRYEVQREEEIDHPTAVGNGDRTEGSNPLHLDGRFGSSGPEV